MKDHCPGDVEEVKKTIREELKTSCTNLCRRSQGSVFYGYDYNSMRDFDFNKIWLEPQARVKVLGTRLNEALGNKPHKLCICSPEPRTEVYCLTLNFDISKFGLLPFPNSLGIISGSSEEKWGSFRGRDHFGSCTDVKMW